MKVSLSMHATEKLQILWSDDFMISEKKVIYTLWFTCELTKILDHKNLELYSTKV